MREEIIDIVKNNYLNSDDFNGIYITHLLNKLDKDWGDIKETLKELILEEILGVIDDKTDINPHIIRLGFESIENQINKLNTDKPGYMCVYPNSKYLKKNIKESDYAYEPYKLMLALGEPQLSYLSFDLTILEYYRNDPRYSYTNDDIQGEIHCIEDNIPEKDRILLQTFGFSYDNDFNRSVAVFLRYLNKLTPEHQQLWKMKELSREFKLHPDYFKITHGDWDLGIPICKALLNEIYIINKMSGIMGRDPLFIKDFGEFSENSPKGFNLLIRPTLKEFNDFILLLDKILSENININFFKNEVKYESEEERKDGKIVISKKGTINILNEWIRKHLKMKDWSPWEETISTLKKVRKLRQEPAHKINENIFDQKYFKEQRLIIINCYNAIRNIRLLFSNHPNIKKSDIKIPEELQNGKLWDR